MVQFKGRREYLQLLINQEKGLFVSGIDAPVDDVHLSLYT